MIRRSTGVATLSLVSSLSASTRSTGGPAGSAQGAREAPFDASRYELVHASCYFRHGARAPIYGLDAPCVRGVEWDACAATAALAAAVDGGADAVVALRRHGTVGDAPAPSDVDARQRLTVLNGGCHCGELTAAGLGQAARLGERLRKRYGAALRIDAPDFEADRLSARTTHVSRCVLTLRGVLETLRGTDDAEAPPRPPVRVDTVHALDEWLTPNARSCARLRDLWAARAPFEWAAHLGSVSDKLDPAVAALYDYPRRAVPLKDAMIARAALGEALPYGITQAELIRLDDAAAAEVAALVGVGVACGVTADELTRLCAGRMLRELRDSLSAAGDETLRLVSGHDTTLKPLLVALGLYDHKWPPFCACLVVELHADRETGDRAVRVVYNGRNIANAEDAAGEFYEARPLTRLSDFFLALDRFVVEDDDAWQTCCGGGAAAADADAATAGGSSF
ncbi:histidine phosphatase superfamily [Pelagophyceae sp. CCMP2097]|nr:histidine phosphatase superfamily [Pelagophyceae sp. CCMP2097]